MAPSILFAGLPWDDPDAAPPPPMTPEQIKEALEKAVEDAVGAGYDFKFVPVVAAEGIEVYTKELKAKKYDAVIIGFGVRGNPRLTEYFEELVNTIVEVSPGTKLGFNSHPSTTLACAQRLAPL